LLRQIGAAKIIFTSLISSNFFIFTKNNSFTIVHTKLLDQSGAKPVFSVHRLFLNN